EHTDGEDFLRTRVVGDLESRLLLNHLFSPVVSPVLTEERAWRNGYGATVRSPPIPGSRRGRGGTGRDGGDGDVTWRALRSPRAASASTPTSDGFRPRRRGHRCLRCSPRHAP